MEEIVALFDEHGRQSGQAPRSEVRGRNLRHGATGIVVFDEAGQIFVHRRTETKDVYPGLFDFTAGGVIQAGEDPDESARREVAEELGVTGELVRLAEADYADDRTRYHSFRYWTVADRPVKMQPEEVAEGRWMSRSEVLELIEADPASFIPDALALFLPWLRDLESVPPTA